MQLLQGYAISSPHFIENKIINKQILKKKKSQKNPQNKTQLPQHSGFFLVRKKGL